MTDGPDRPPDNSPGTVIVRFRVPQQRRAIATDATLAPGSQVVVQAGRDTALGTVVAHSTAATAEPSMLRQATPEDLAQAVRHRELEHEAFHLCKEKIRQQQLPMKLVSVEVSQSGKRAIFYFSSSARVDFRNLVRELARHFHLRIEMRQIGVRDAAAHAGGIGVCGRQTCCSAFLPVFEPVSIRMAKSQNLSLNHEKLAGVCGRLRCCLQYEHALYEERRKQLPKIGKRVQTPQGTGKVKDINVLEGTAGVVLAAGTYVVVPADAIEKLQDVSGSQAATEGATPKRKKQRRRRS